MKVGMIFECGPAGADRKVCEHLVKQIDSTIEIESITLDNKKNLVSQCGKTARQLLVGGCDRVVIMWDLHPSWRETAPCRKRDRDDILRSLSASDVTATRVFLVCIEEELEAWLLADNRAIEAVLSKPHRPVRISRERHAERVNNPKKQMMQIFRENARRPYNDLIHAEQIAKAIPDLDRLRRVETFVRFALKVADKVL
jgi:hypothetical protein